MSELERARGCARSTPSAAWRTHGSRPQPSPHQAPPASPRRPPRPGSTAACLACHCTHQQSRCEGESARSWRLCARSSIRGVAHGSEALASAIRSESIAIGVCAPVPPLRGERESRAGEHRVGELERACAIAGRGCWRGCMSGSMYCAGPREAVAADTGTQPRGGGRGFNARQHVRAAVVVDVVGGVVVRVLQRRPCCGRRRATACASQS